MFDIHHLQDLKTDLGGFNVKWMDSKRKVISSLMSGEYRKIPLLLFRKQPCCFLLLTHGSQYREGWKAQQWDHLITSLLKHGQLRAHCMALHPDSSWIILSEGESTTSLGYLLQCTITSTLKQLFLIFRWTFLSNSFSSCCLLSFSLA